MSRAKLRSSDIFWSTTETFIETWMIGVSLAITLGWSVVHISSFCVQARGVPHAIRATPRMLAVAWRGVWMKPALWLKGRLQYRGVSQVFRENHTLEKFLVNLIVCCGLLLSAAIALLICGLTTMIIILTGLALAAAAAAAIYALGLFLHATRLLAIKTVHEKYHGLWCGPDSVHDTAEHLVEEIDQRVWNQIVLGEVLFEALPSMALNAYNMRAMQTTFNQPISYPAIISITVSAFAVSRHLYRFVYWMGVHGRVLADVPADPATKTAAVRACASHGEEVAGSTIKVDPSAIGRILSP